MVFSTNQNRQFYVANSVVTEEPTALGEIKMSKSVDSKQIFFKHFGQGGRTRTDIIDVANISYAKLTKKEEMRRFLKKAVISLDPSLNEGKPISGQDYIVRIVLNGYLLPGEDNMLIKHGMVHAYAGLTAEDFYKRLAKSLEMNFSRDNNAYFKFEATTTGVVVTELEQPWALGVRAQEFLDFNIYGAQVKFQGEDVNWVKGDEEGKIATENTATAVGNGKKVADLEYFCMGERGDQYRNVGRPYVITTKYMVDSAKEYDMLDIHYSYIGDGISVQKSEKDITIVSSEGALTALKTALEGAGVEVTEKASATEP